MKKLYNLLHNPDVQGGILIAVIFTAIAVATILTWGK
jgi:hypothetical protein